MHFDWKPELAVGVHEIDEQHREIFRRAAALFDACALGKGRAEVAGVLAFLQDYIRNHFQAEEKLQERVGYPGRDAHRQMHTQMARSLNDLTKHLTERGVGLELVVLTNRLVVEWLTNHIRKEDRAVADHVHGRSSSSHPGQRRRLRQR